jgi:hypothetical protein
MYCRKKINSNLRLNSININFKIEHSKGSESSTMDDRFDFKKVVLIVGMTIAIAFVIIALIWVYSYMNKIDQDSVSITPNKFFCPLGKEMDTPVVIKLESLNEVFHQDYDVGDLVVSSLMSNKPILDLANKMYGIFKDTDRKNEIKEIKQIEIPKNAWHIGSMDKVSKSIDQAVISDLKSDFLNSDIKLYAWNREYKLNSGKEESEIHLVMSFNEKIVYGKIKKSGSMKMQMDIQFGFKN